MPESNLYDITENQTNPSPRGPKQRWGAVLSLLLWVAVIWRLPLDRDSFLTLVMGRTANPVEQYLLPDILMGITTIVLVLIPVAVAVGWYALLSWKERHTLVKGTLVVEGKNRSRMVVENTHIQQRFTSERARNAYGAYLVAQLLFGAFTLMILLYGSGFRPHCSDWLRYHFGEPEIRYGSFQQNWSPEEYPEGYSVRIYPEGFLRGVKPVTELQGPAPVPDRGWIPAAYYDGSPLFQEQYRIAYLPHSAIVLEIEDSDGVMRAGPHFQAIPDPPADHWVFGDIPIPRAEGAYGYDSLTPDQQRWFDLCKYYLTGSGQNRPARHRQSYDTGHYLLRPEDVFAWARHSDSDGHRVYADYVPAWSGEAQERVTALFQSTHSAELSLLWYHGPERVSQGGNGEEDYLKLLEALEEMADEILETVPEGAGERERVRVVAQHLADHVRYRYVPNNDFETRWMMGETGNPPKHSLYTVRPYGTAGAALESGMGDTTAHVQAFDYLARRAGLKTVPVVGQPAEEMERDALPGHGTLWNLVRIDGAWYQLDPTWIESGDVTDSPYFLMEAETLPDTRNPREIAGCDFLALPIPLGGKT